MNDQITTFFGDSQNAPACQSIYNGSVAMFSARSPSKLMVNEDAYAIIPIDEATLILAVADGAGGHPQGDVASRLAIQGLVEEIRAGSGLPPRVAIVNGFEAGQNLIMEQAPRAATTLVVVEITNRTVRTYHAGDSGACVIGGRGKYKMQTVFHSPTGYAVEAGLLTEIQAMHDDARHIVSNTLGALNMSLEIGTPVELAPRDTVVIASDGLFDNLLSDEISALACRGTIDTACGALVDAATARMLETDRGHPRKPDDLTVLIYRQNQT